MHLPNAFFKLCMIVLIQNTVSESIKIKLRTTLFTLNYVWHFILFAVSLSTFSNSIQVTYFKTTFKQIRILFLFFVVYVFCSEVRLEVMSTSNVFYSCFAGNIKGIRLNYLETYRNRFSKSSAILFLICIRYIDWNYTGSVWILK